MAFTVHPYGQILSNVWAVGSADPKHKTSHSNISFVGFEHI